MVTRSTPAAAPASHDDLEGSRAQWRNLGLLALAEVLGMSLWFSASAVSPALQDTWGLSVASAAWLTMAVQIGFVAGTAVSGVINLPDIVSSRRLFVVSALLGAAANAGFAFLASGLPSGIVLRFLTGFCLAGVYPPGMKLAATWTRRHRGLAIGLVVGALTVGSAAPHLVRSLATTGEVCTLLGAIGLCSPGAQTLSWANVILVSSALAIVGGLIVALPFREGPFVSAGAQFNPRFALSIFTQRGLRLANFGYLGHQWELYAMWTWVPIFLVERVTTGGGSSTLAALLAFAVVGSGGIGCLVTGAGADRVGRTATTSAAMIVSGSMAVLAAVFYAAPLPLLTAILLIWGVSVVADSAQFSASITELSPPEYTGTALTIQTSVGFLLTMVSIQLVPLVVAAAGWPAAFVMLAIGPALGTVAMLKLRRLPEAMQLAGGRR